VADAPGTCHLVGCAGKGTRDQHVAVTIGCADTFEPYRASTVTRSHVELPKSIAARLATLLVVVPIVHAVHAEEAWILRRELILALAT
jgi:hypothetical protein